MNPDLAIILALIVFFIGAVGLVLRHNLIFMLMCIELMLNAVNVVFVSGSRLHGGLDGQVAVFFTITVAACEAAVGLALAIAFFRRCGTLETDAMRILRG